MADNVELDPGTGGANVATDDVGGVHFQKVKLDGGGDGSSTAIAAGGGVEAGALRVTVASDSTGVLSVDDNGASLTVDGTVTANLAAGTNNIGDVDVLTLPSIPAGTNNIGDVDVLTIAAGTNAIGNVGIVPRTTGGLTPFKLLDIDETEDEIKGTAGQVFGWYLYNDGAAEVYVKFYNATAASVTVGSTTPVFVLPIPAGAAANVFTEAGIAFSTAITVAATTAAADADTGAPATNQVVGTVFYA